MRLGLTTEGAETPVRAARKEACERIRFAQLGRNSPTLDGRQMICGRGVDEWHEVRLPPSSFRAPRSGFPRFQWLTDLSTAPRIKCAPSPDRGIDNSALSAQMDLTLFVYTLENPNGGAIAAAFRLLPFAAGKRFGDIEVIGADALIGIEDVELDQHADRRRGVVRANAHELALATGTDQLMESSRFGL